MEMFGFKMEACSSSYGISSSYDCSSSKRIRLDSFSDWSSDDSLSRLSENVEFYTPYGVPSPASSESDLSQTSLAFSDAAADMKFSLSTPPPMMRSGYMPPPPAMKYKERHKLTIDIQRLNSDQLLQVIDIVLNSEAMKLSANDELEVDFEVLKDSTLWQLRDFASTCLHHEPTHTKPTKRPSMSSSSDSEDCRSCVSCGTTSTPTWRESEGCLHCNACGLRYKKLGVRCRTAGCGFVPHAANASKPCPKCNCAFS